MSQCGEMLSQLERFDRSKLKKTSTKVTTKSGQVFLETKDHDQYQLVAQVVLFLCVCVCVCVCGVVCVE